MKIVTSIFTNHAINYQPNSIGCTTDTTLKYEDGRLLGGCDHFMKKSFNEIVAYYTRRIKREGAVGTHVVTIRVENQDFTIVLETA
jgi:hypothetical protein